MNIENWVIQLFTEIESAADKDESYDLHLTQEMVKDIAFESRSLEWIEMY